MMKIEVEPGRIVRSRAGRDQGRRFVVIACEGEYASIADGQLRKTDRPKKKKLKHLEATKDRMERMPDGRAPEDHEIRSALKATEPEEEG